MANTVAIEICEWYKLRDKCPWHEESEYHRMDNICIATPWNNGRPRECCKERCAPYYFIAQSNI